MYDYEKGSSGCIAIVCVFVVVVPWKKLQVSEKHGDCEEKNGSSEISRGYLSCLPTRENTAERSLPCIRKSHWFRSMGRYTKRQLLNAYI